MKLLTWNTEGGKPFDVRSILQKKSVDVCCLQEAGSDPWQLSDLVDDDGHPVQPSEGQLREIRTNRGSEDYYLWYYRWSKGGKVNLAIAWKKRLFTPSDATELGNRLVLIGPMKPRTETRRGSRPAIGVLFPGSEVTVFSLHALAGSGGDVKHLLREITDTTLGKWIAVGDYNKDPEKTRKNLAQLAQEEEAEDEDQMRDEDDGLSASVCPPNQATHNGGQYDYAVATAEPRFGEVQTGMTADHFPVLYEF